MKVTLPYSDNKEIANAAAFINSLIATGTAVFSAKVVGNEMIITFTGGY